jgi:hypothetical protein
VQLEIAGKTARAVGGSMGVFPNPPAQSRHNPPTWSAQSISSGGRPPERTPGPWLLGFSRFNFLSFDLKNISKRDFPEVSSQHLKIKYVIE